MKGKSKYLVLLILLLIICSGLVTYALFRTNKSGSGNINAARWNVVFKNGEDTIFDNFEISLNNATWTNPLGNVASGKIAPGSYATFYITIDATNTETDVDYTVEIDETFNESDFEVTLADDSGTIFYSTVEDAMIRQIPIQVIWNGNIDDNNDKNENDLLKKARDIIIPIKITASQKLPLKYTVNFNVDGIIVETLKLNKNTPIGTLPASPTKVGYTFAGWYDAETNGNEVTPETLVTPGMNIYAYWNIKNVTVTFDSNGGSSVVPIEVQEGSIILDIPTTSYEGFDFLGWYDNNEQLLTISTQILEDITYTARWNLPNYENAGEIVYFDPVSNSDCNPATFNLANVNNGTSTCYKWRVISDNSNLATIQLDHNIVNKTAWNTTSSNTNGPVTALTNLASATSSWTRVSPLNYSYDTSSSSNNYGKLSCSNGTCTISKTETQITNMKARLITGEEIAIINGNSNWRLNNQSSFSNLSPWLLENTESSDYLNTNYGYWSLSPSSSDSSRAYRVQSDNEFNYTSSSISGQTIVSYSSGFGVRPVISISKNNLFYENDSYKVTFNSNGGSFIQPIFFITTGNTISNIPIPIRNNYEFLGWYDSNNNKLTTSTIINESVVYTAQWYSNAGQLVYYDPVSTNPCNSNSFNLTNVNNGTSTCYKWRKIVEDDNTITLQLDHNLIENVSYSNISTNIGVTMQSMANATSNWSKVSPLNYEYDSSLASTNYGKLTCTNGTCTVNGVTINNVKARLITGEEVANITSLETDGTTLADNWTLSNQDYFYFSHNGYIIGTHSTGSGNKNLSWLIENSYSDSSSGATNNVYGSNDDGYITLSPRPRMSNFYLVHNDGFLGFGGSSDIIGARPVITINKNINLSFIFQDGSSNLQKSYRFGDVIGTLPTPNERENFTFLGWSTTSNGLTGFINSNTIVEFDTIYAVWQSNIFTNFTYDSNSINNPSPMLYVAPRTGTYQLEVWGASGGDATTTYKGGKGGYAIGNIRLTQGDELYVVLGKQGVYCSTETICEGGYNGGGNSYYYANNGGSGGGATHIGTFNDTLANHNSTNGLYIVAGGGGGSSSLQRQSTYASGGNGGGAIGGLPTVSSNKSHKIVGTGGNQVQGGNYGLYYNSSYAGISSQASNGKFGLGGSYSSTGADTYISGGGGGFYGGGAGYITGGTGGSSYIDGVTNGSTIDGGSSMPSPIGGTETGHSGNGYARITFISE